MEDDLRKFKVEDDKKVKNENQIKDDQKIF